MTSIYWILLTPFINYKLIKTQIKTFDMTNYEQQATDFLTKTGATLTIEFLKNGKHFEDDKDNRDIYKCTLTSGKRSYTFNFGNSLNNSGFYVSIGVQKIPIDRKLIGSKNLHGHIRSKYFYDFNPVTDKVHYPTPPTPYDILSCLQNYEVGTFENFCSEFGYDTDSIKASKIYEAVKDEYLNIARLFNEDELEQLQEIN